MPDESAAKVVSGPANTVEGTEKAVADLKQKRSEAGKLGAAAKQAKQNGQQTEQTNTCTALQVIPKEKSLFDQTIDEMEAWLKS